MRELFGIIIIYYKSKSTNPREPYKSVLPARNYSAIELSYAYGFFSSMYSKSNVINTISEMFPEFHVNP